MAPANTQFAIAVHICAVLGSRGALAEVTPAICVTSASLASSVNASPSFVRRVLAVLSRSGLVRTSRGASGSCALTRAPEEISMLDIYRAVHAPKVFSLHSYPPKDKCAVSCQMGQAMASLLEAAQSGMEDALNSVSLAEFIAKLELASRPS